MDSKDMLALANAGVSISEIGRRAGVRRQRVSQILIAAGMPRATCHRTQHAIGIDPAYSIIMAFGLALPGPKGNAYTRGVQHLAALTGVTDRQVRRWPSKTGTQGVIPTRYRKDILAEATRIGAKVSARTFTSSALPERANRSTG